MVHKPEFAGLRKLIAEYKTKTNLTTEAFAYDELGRDVFSK